jgi:urease accessory protein
MSLPPYPFPATASVPGEGLIELRARAPNQQVLSALTYQYPLKIISPDPHRALNERQDPVTVIFLLTYGGGLVGGDKIDLDVDLGDHTRLVLLTQGSTKIFKSPTASVVSRQILNVDVGKGAALCHLPDPTQPFDNSVYEQCQTFHLDPNAGSSLCVLDWVSEGRRARGESWTLNSWQSRNEVRELVSKGNVPGRLLLRDAMALASDGDGALRRKTNEMGVFGSLILYGAVFKTLADYFLKEFSNQPRIGAKNWTSGDGSEEKSAEQMRRDQRHRREKADGLLWTASAVRGFVLVRFGATEINGARSWLRTVVGEEGSVEREFGHQALFSLR